jgi:CheY-like chemotaxis protein
MQLSDATILVVDDEPYYREIASEWLKREGCRVLTAADGAEALEHIRNNKVHAILTDIRMPRLDGTELIKQVKAFGAYTPTALSISGFSDLSPRDAYDLGIEAQLAKPISRKVLISALQRALLDREDVWALPPRPGKIPRLGFRYDSLATAIDKGLISFGHGGFCLRADVTQREESSIAFELHFAADQNVLSGQGVLRWIAATERLVGIEIFRLDDPGRAWLAAATRGSTTVSFIPRSTNEAT